MQLLKISLTGDTNPRYKHQYACILWGFMVTGTSHDIDNALTHRH